jgi:phosphoenolpyruvate synthase/pyruvate phosphate dikinase
MEKIKKSEYFLTGSTETGFIYLYLPSKHILKKFKGKGFFYSINGFLTGFFNKEMITRMKEALLRNSSDKLEKKFKRWKKEWQKHKEFYQLATKPSNNWRENWGKLDKLNSKFWVGSYQIETIDSFGAELKKTIESNLKKLGLDKNLADKLISPAKLTPVQALARDREKIKKGKISKTAYLNKYWYCHGSWNGGEQLTKALLEKDLRQKQTKIDLKSIKKIHYFVDQKLDKNFRNLVRLLRILSLWRDERKVLMQKINLGYERVIKDASKELQVSPDLLKFCLLKEVNEISTNQEKFISRREMSVAVYDFSKEKTEEKIVIGREALEIINKFCQSTKKSTLKGTSASKGLTTGIAKIILRKKDFSEFKKGMILITTMTRPEFFSLMKKAKAIITDEGGITSHAAIISRELNIPCIVGTKIATKVLKDGDLVEVDADKGITRIIK